MQNIFHGGQTQKENFNVWNFSSLSKEQPSEIGRVLVQPSFEEGFAINFLNVLTKTNCKQLLLNSFENKPYIYVHSLVAQNFKVFSSSTT